MNGEVKHVQSVPNGAATPTAAIKGKDFMLVEMLRDVRYSAIEGGVSE